MTPDSNLNQNPPLTVPSDTTVNPESIANYSIQEDLIAETQKTLTEKDEGKTVTKSKYSKRKLGGGLYEKFKDNKSTGYQFRKMIDGIIMNIPLGEMTEEQARKEIERLTKRPSKLQRTRKVEVALSKMKDLAEETMPCFKSYEDARLFTQSLYKNLMESKHTFQNRNSDGLDLEIYTIIWTMLSTPLSLDELLNTTWAKIFLDDDLAHALEPDLMKRAIITLEQESPNEIRLLVNLTNVTTQAIQALKSHWGSNPDQLIFQRMNALDQEVRKKQIATKIETIWPTYSIRPEKFNPFFQYVANRHSSFRHDFIESYTKKLAGSLRWVVDYYDDRKTLSTWWEKQIIEKQFRFQSIPSSKTIEAERPHSESNRGRLALKFQTPVRRPQKQTGLPNS